MMISLEHRHSQGLQWIDSQEPYIVSVLLTQDRWRILWESTFEEKVRMSALVIQVSDSIGVERFLKSACILRLKVRRLASHPYRIYLGSGRKHYRHDTLLKHCLHKYEQALYHHDEFQRNQSLAFIQMTPLHVETQIASQSHLTTVLNNGNITSSQPLVLAGVARAV